MTVLNTPFGRWRFEGDLGLETLIILDNNREVSFQHIIKQTNGDALDWVEEYETERLAKYAEGQARDSHGRFASGGVANDLHSYLDRQTLKDRWQTPPIKLVPIGSKVLPSGWDYVPAKKGAAFMSEYIYGKGSSMDKVIAIEYYQKLADKGQLEIYKHSSGLVFTVEREDVTNLTSEQKFEKMMLCADVYKGNKVNIAGNMLVRIDSASADWRNAMGYAGDSRHSGSVFGGGRAVKAGSRSVNSKMVVLRANASKATIVHEFGHIVSFEAYRDTGSDRNISWAKMEKTRKKYHFSEYSRSSSAEWYAETYLHWVSNGGNFDFTKYATATTEQQNALTNFAKDQNWQLPASMKGK